MLKDVTLGRYYPADSFLHGLDPRTKMAGALVYIVSVFIADSPLACAFVVGWLCFLAILSRVPLGYMLRGLAPVAVLVLAVCILNIALSRGGAWNAVLITQRMVELVLVSNLVTLTTKPKTLADGLEKGLGWLGLFKVPVHDLATTISIALRFIPILSAEAGQVMDAQRARGADFGRGLRRSMALMPLLVPMFVSAFRKADSLSVAMDSRLYGSTEAGRFRPLRYGRGDAAAYILVLTQLAVCILLGRLAA